MADETYTSIPTDLPPRFQVRRLEEKHIPWAIAIVVHSNLFHSPVWPVTYPSDKCARAYKTFEAGDYIVRHQVMSGLSFGVFDTEYQFKQPKSTELGGNLYWDASHPSQDESGAELLDQMDFPLCSIALAYDGIAPLDGEKLMPLVACLPAFADIYHELEAKDTRTAESWKPTAAGEVLMRNATSSRADIEGKQIMKKLAYFLMRFAHSRGFRGIQIECAHDKVTWVWTHPPSPFRADLVAQFNSWEYEVDEEEGGTKTGRKVKPFGDAKQTFTKVYVHLKPE